MNVPVPEKLKSADVSRFVERGKAVEKYKPAVAYWCYYWAMDQIQTKGLHKADDDCKLYFRHLIEKVTAMNAEYSTDDAVADKLTGQAYVEQFALETFQRADNAVRAKRATKQTVETFKAALTFFDVLDIWGNITPEVTIKRKHAKYQILRITKSLRAGEDPNLSPPHEEETPKAQTTDLGGDSLGAVQSANITYQPTAEQVVDESHNNVSTTMQTQTLDDVASFPEPSPLPDGLKNIPLSEAASSNPPAVSPITYDPPATSNTARENSRQSSVGGGYFPDIQVPETAIEKDQKQIHNASELTTTIVAPSSLQVKPADLENLHSNSAQPSLEGSVPSPPTVEDYRSQPLQQAPQIAPGLAPPGDTKTVLQNPDSILQAQTHTESERWQADDRSISEAQKHAKWAISALNFDDVPTAVKELREALSALTTR